MVFVTRNVNTLLIGWGRRAVEERHEHWRGEVQWVRDVQQTHTGWRAPTVRGQRFMKFRDHFVTQNFCNNQRNKRFVTQLLVGDTDQCKNTNLSSGLVQRPCPWWHRDLDTRKKSLQVREKNTIHNYVISSSAHIKVDEKQQLGQRNGTCTKKRCSYILLAPLRSCC